jgi:hypothetical protein
LINKRESYRGIYTQRNLIITTFYFKKTKEGELKFKLVDIDSQRAKEWTQKIQKRYSSQDQARMREPSIFRKLVLGQSSHSDLKIPLSLKRIYELVH